MDCTIKDGRLLISIPVNAIPAPSSSGKTLLVATTHGFVMTGAMVDGKPVKLSLSATIAK